MWPPVESAMSKYNIRTGCADMRNYGNSNVLLKFLYPENTWFIRLWDFYELWSVKYKLWKYKVTVPGNNIKMVLLLLLI